MQAEKAPLRSLALSSLFLMLFLPLSRRSPQAAVSAAADACDPNHIWKCMQDHLQPLSPSLLAHIPDLRPVDEAYPETSGFGRRLHPILKDSILHEGLDFGAPEGASVRSAAEGIVVSVSQLEDSSNYGICVVIEHASARFAGETYSTRYAHLSKVLVRSGQRVQKGQLIGKVGNTGRSTDYHLHYEVHLNGQPVDPRDFLPPVSESQDAAVQPGRS